MNEDSELFLLPDNLTDADYEAMARAMNEARGIPHPKPDERLQFAVLPHNPTREDFQRMADFLNGEGEFGETDNSGA